MSELKIYNNAMFGNIRATTINNEPYFVAKDITQILGYTNASKAIADHVDEEDKLNNNSLSSLGQRGGWLINESGLYSLILSSKMPRAKEFKHWVTSEVLPSIRKHGAYMTEKTVEQALTDPDFLIRLATELKKEKEKSAELEEKNRQMLPKAIFADAVSVSNTSILIGELAKILRQNGVNTGQQRLFQTLRDEGYLIKGGSSKNMPTQRAMEMGLFEIKESSVNNPNGSVRVTKTTKVTGKGQLYFVNRFLKKGEKDD